MSLKQKRKCAVLSIAVLIAIIYINIPHSVVNSILKCENSSQFCSNESVESNVVLTKVIRDNLINRSLRETFKIYHLNEGAYEKSKSGDDGGVSGSPLGNKTNISFINNRSGVRNKLILFWDKWFHSEWIKRFTDQDTLDIEGCPSFQCEFTYNRSRLNMADAVLFRPAQFHYARKLVRPNNSQRWIFVEVESPINSYEARDVEYNWTMTYHTSADVLAFYGYFTPINYSVRSLRPNLMDYQSSTMKEYIEQLSSNETLTEAFGFQLPSSFIRRSRLAAWMSSHCPTPSKRENIIMQLQKWIEIDTFGKCGKYSCFERNPYDPQCWNRTLNKYFFYFSMENSLCDEYITEKLYNPLFYGLVPVVYGGSNYSRFLPPHSYIDAVKYSPRDLAALLLKLQMDPEVYGRYHLWRKYWKVHVGGSFCELCHKLHVDKSSSRHYSFSKFRKQHEHCFNPSNKYG